MKSTQTAATLSEQRVVAPASSTCGVAESGGRVRLHFDAAIADACADPLDEQHAATGVAPS